MFKTKKDTNNYSTCDYNEKIIISNLKNRKKMGVIGISCQFQTIAKSDGFFITIVSSISS